MTESQKAREEKIDSLVRNPPKIRRTPLQWVVWIVGRLAAVAGVIGLAISLVALVGKAHLAECTNNNLGDRNGVQTEQSNAEKAAIREMNLWAGVLFGAFTDPNAKTDGTVQTFKTATGELQTVTGQSLATLQAVQDYRASHPLGKC